jgi:hypothetical protein
MARHGRIAAMAAGFTIAIMGLAAGPAAALEPADFHGQWGVGSPVACEDAETMIFTASGGWASTRLGSANQTEAVGTWAFDAAVGLDLAFSEVLAPGRVIEAVFEAEQTDPDQITLSTDLFDGGSLVLHRCPD